MAIIPPPVPPAKPLATVATPDTVGVFMRWPPRGLRRLLMAAATAERDVQIRGCPGGGVRAEVNRPNTAVIELMRRLTGERQLICCVKRVDIAVDFRMRDEEEARALAGWLVRQIKLKWRSKRGRKRYLREEDQRRGAFWVLWTGGHKPRDLCVYVKPGNVVRMELRFQKAAAVRRAGLDKLEELENLDVRKLIGRNITAEKLTERRITSIIRKTHKDDMMRHRASKRRGDHPVTDQYRARIPARVRRMLSQLDMQEARPSTGTEKIELDWLSIPTRVTIPERDVEEASKGGAGLKCKGKSGRMGDSGGLLRPTVAEAGIGKGRPSLGRR